MAKEMTLLEHVDELRRRLIYIMATVGAITVFCFTFGLRALWLGDYLIYVPYPQIYDNISTMFLKRLRSDLVPGYVDLMVTAPSEALLALIYVSLFLGVLLGMPVIVYQLARFISPGLHSHEKRLIAKILVPATLLFILGALFSYFLVIPFTIDFLFTYGLALEVRTFLTISGFVSFVLYFLLAFGLAFELPIFMVGLSSLGVVEPSFWRNNFSYAVLAMVIFGAVVTPDGSGITMFMVAAPMILLYFLGYLVAKRGRKRME